MYAGIHPNGKPKGIEGVPAVAREIDRAQPPNTQGCPHPCSASFKGLTTAFYLNHVSISFSVSWWQLCKPHED